MTGWSSRSAYFNVKIRYTAKGRAQITIPAPIINRLAEKPDTIMFYLADNRIYVQLKPAVTKPKGCV